MSRTAVFLASLLLLLGGCSTAHAHPGGRHVAHGRAMYSVSLIRPDGSQLATYQLAGRTYIMGEVGERYLVRVHNMTGRRVEAVISVDGLDVIDGRTAHMNKRGYLVSPYGWVDVDGFRVSEAQVASFRFSSVGGSYAGRKGQARNVGVIGVAVFAERDQPVVVQPPPPRPHYAPHDPYYDDDYDRSPRSESRSKAPDSPSEGRAPAAPSGKRGEASAEDEGSMGGATHGYGGSSDRSVAPSPANPPPERRPGLGTEFGEYRHSAVTFVSFERRHPTRPDAVLELRYNDRDGLAALGIPVPPLPSHDEVWTRETATPFPSYATPP